LGKSDEQSLALLDLSSFDCRYCCRGMVRDYEVNIRLRNLKTQRLLACSNQDAAKFTSDPPFHRLATPICPITDLGMRLSRLNVRCLKVQQTF